MAALHLAWQGDIIISVAGPRTSFISFKFSLLLCALKGFLDNGAAKYEKKKKLLTHLVISCRLPSADCLSFCRQCPTMRILNAYT